MEWVETTGRTVEDAKEAALDQLGVDESEAEFDVLEEAKAGLFGRVRREARVRARIRPEPVRPKTEKRERRRRSGSTAAKGRNGEKRNDNGNGNGNGDGDAARSDGKAARPRRSGGSDKKASAPRGAAGGTSMAVEMTIDEQTDVIVEFTRGLVEAFGLQGDTRVEKIDEENVELHVEGGDLGLLIGPKGQTLAAVQDLARTVVLRKAETAHGRVRIDVSGYRARRKEALERFATQVAGDVVESGTEQALEPMSPPDRKIVHDTVNEIEGVTTISEGEEPRRRVVIKPEG